ncbi:uncharacterized protein DS421_16g540760 [Arachis hypogaea]|nr:uncharacterized protein DS421_16g540760 [Arachis hypogaea]
MYIKQKNCNPSSLNETHQYGALDLPSLSPSSPPCKEALRQRRSFLSASPLSAGYDFSSSVLESCVEAFN